MKYFKHTAGVMFMAMATSISIIPYNSDSTSNANDVVVSGDYSPTKTEGLEETPIPDKTETNKVDEEDESPEPSETIELPDLFIKAVNPGYNLEQKETGEFIELMNSTGEQLDLTGVSLLYTNTKGNTSVLYEFPNESIMAGETIVLRYYKSPENMEADGVYKTSLALTGTTLQLVQNETTLDSVCWNGKDDCYATFKTASPTTLVRQLESLKFEPMAMELYQPAFSTSEPSLILPIVDLENQNGADSDNKNNSNTDNDKAVKTPHCQGLEFSEILTYYEESSDEQFVELYNSTNQEINLEGCIIKYKSKRHDLIGVVPANSYYAFYPEDFTFTKNPTKTNTLELLDTNDTKLDELTYVHGQKQLTTYARFGDGQWLITYNPTPNATNIFQEFPTCEEGKVINPATGKCVKSSSISTSSKTLADCPAGKYRNPLTGRCKNIETATTLKECAEGYERNPDTGRCRKIKTENQGTDYPLVPETYADNKTFIAFGAVGLVVLAGISYVIWQYRREIGRTLRKIRNRFH